MKYQGIEARSNTRYSMHLSREWNKKSNVSKFQVWN